MRLVVLIVLVVALVATLLVLWAAYRLAARRAAEARAAGERYRLVETTGGGEAHVFISRGSPETAVLIGSVSVSDERFDERYAELIAQAEDRIATLNASRELHADG